MDINELKSATIYQSYEDLWMDGKNSKSKQKLDALNFDPKWLRILDVWCNTWYFPIRYSQAGASYVVGIDVDRAGWAGMDVIKLAKGYTKHYWIENIEFHINSIFDELDFTHKFDAISCLSTFHYFRERQEEFFKICNKLLNNGWLIIREWWVPEKSELYSRWVDETPCRFPDKEELTAMWKKEWFDVVFTWKSVDQKGDKIPRYVYHFKKI